MLEQKSDTVVRIQSYIVYTSYYWFCFQGYLHSADGTMSKMVCHECEAARTIFVPEDPSICMACATMDPGEPHTHPILPATKVSFKIKKMYQECILAAGVHGQTVRTIDNGE